MSRHPFPDEIYAALTSPPDHFRRLYAARPDRGIEMLRFAPVPDDAQLDAILGKRLAGETLSELRSPGYHGGGADASWAVSTPRAAGDAATYWRDPAIAADVPPAGAGSGTAPVLAIITLAGRSPFTLDGMDVTMNFAQDYPLLPEPRDNGVTATMIE